MHLYEFLHLTYNEKSLMEYLINKKVIRDRIQCPRCNNIIIYTNNIYSNYTMHCTNKYYKVLPKRKRQKLTCNFKISMLKDTWFSKIHLDIVKICRFIGYFLMIQPPRHYFLNNELEMPENTVVDWTNFCREVNKFYKTLIFNNDV